ncbi:MAG: hypothetical protein RMJ54_08890 [Roseiflexaceae bacterium]|nr:hypothetical protein [Roseiflexus sp.]MDW8145638.1 hypothetical protein [Roseiflexaceae bacterium]MDW8232886.1 hypothetical protein [Roseiflexaceae bacterium]
MPITAGTAGAATGGAINAPDDCPTVCSNGFVIALWQTGGAINAPGSRQRMHRCAGDSH